MDTTLRKTDDRFFLLLFHRHLSTICYGKYCIPYVNHQSRGHYSKFLMLTIFLSLASNQNIFNWQFDIGEIFQDYIVSECGK